MDKPARTQYDPTHELQHADVNDWIVKYPSGRVAIIRQVHFEEYFEPLAAEPLSYVGDGAATRDVPFVPGEPIVATHPRVLEDLDRQPATEPDAHTVSER